MTDEAATSHGVIFQIISIEWLFDAKLPKLQKIERVNHREASHVSLETRRAVADQSQSESNFWCQK